jgi:hypothetical protein
LDGWGDWIHHGGAESAEVWKDEDEFTTEITEDTESLKG